MNKYHTLGSKSMSWSFLLTANCILFNWIWGFFAVWVKGPIVSVEQLTLGRGHTSNIHSEHMYSMGACSSFFTLLTRSPVRSISEATPKRPNDHCFCSSWNIFKLQQNATFYTQDASFNWLWIQLCRIHLAFCLDTIVSSDGNVVMMDGKWVLKIKWTTGAVFLLFMGFPPPCMIKVISAHSLIHHSLFLIILFPKPMFGDIPRMSFR